jgi:hypothetical protein
MNLKLMRLNASFSVLKSCVINILKKYATFVEVNVNVEQCKKNKEAL